MDTLAKGANLAQKGFDKADDLGFSVPDTFGSTVPSAAPPGLMNSIAQQVNAASPPKTALLDNARQLTSQQVQNAVNLADADARNRAAGGPGLFQGGKPRRTRRTRKRSSGSRRARKLRGRR